MVKIERVRRSIPAGTARKLWVKVGGRCQHDGCNKPLWKDELMKRDMNKAYISHIIGARKNGPRGDALRSKELEIAYSNLLLQCCKRPFFPAPARATQPARWKLRQ